MLNARKKRLSQYVNIMTFYFCTLSQKKLTIFKMKVHINENVHNYICILNFEFSTVINDNLSLRFPPTRYYIISKLQPYYFLKT